MYGEHLKRGHEQLSGFSLLVNSTACLCGYDYQDINHIFWSCSLKEERKILVTILRNLKLQDPFSVEYVLGKLNKKIAATICKYMEIANVKLKLSL